MGEPLGYLITWTAYGSWLRGDDRSWVDRRHALYGTPFRAPEPPRVAISRERMKESAVILRCSDRKVVEESLRETCKFKGWYVHEVSVQWNHVHVVVTAPGTPPEQVQKTLKRYSSIALSREHPEIDKDRWWTKGGSKRYLFEEESLLRAIDYVRNQGENY